MPLIYIEMTHSLIISLRLLVFRCSPGLRLHLVVSHVAKWFLAKTECMTTTIISRQFRNTSGNHRIAVLFHSHLDSRRCLETFQNISLLFWQYRKCRNRMCCSESCHAPEYTIKICRCFLVVNAVCTVTNLPPSSFPTISRSLALRSTYIRFMVPLSLCHCT